MTLHVDSEPSFAICPELVLLILIILPSCRTFCYCQAYIGSQANDGNASSFFTYIYNIAGVNGFFFSFRAASKTHWRIWAMPWGRHHDDGDDVRVCHVDAHCLSILLCQVDETVYSVRVDNTAAAAVWTSVSR